MSKIYFQGLYKCISDHFKISVSEVEKVCESYFSGNDVIEESKLDQQIIQQIEKARSEDRYYCADTRRNIKRTNPSYVYNKKYRIAGKENSKKFTELLSVLQKMDPPVEKKSPPKSVSSLKSIPKQESSKSVSSPKPILKSPKQEIPKSPNEEKTQDVEKDDIDLLSDLLEAIGNY